MGWLKENWFKIIISLGIILVAGSFFYYLVVLPSQKESYKRRVDLEEQVRQTLKEKEVEQKQTEIQSQRNLCLLDADLHSSKLEELNGTKTKEGYSVPLDTREWIDRTIKAEKDECFKKYPIN